eukprot:m.235230 g.235230  ORF g.235230 m.235230 type:complete len:209 (+) comp54310_c2_seq17:1055-1681(+)
MTTTTTITTVKATSATTLTTTTTRSVSSVSSTSSPSSTESAISSSSSSRSVGFGVGLGVGLAVLLVLLILLLVLIRRRNSASRAKQHEQNTVEMSANPLHETGPAPNISASALYLQPKSRRAFEEREYEGVDGPAGERIVSQGTAAPRELRAAGPQPLLAAPYAMLNRPHQGYEEIGVVGSRSVGESRRRAEESSTEDFGFPRHMPNP